EQQPKGHRGDEGRHGAPGDDSGLLADRLPPRMDFRDRWLLRAHCVALRFGTHRWKTRITEHLLRLFAEDLPHLLAVDRAPLRVLVEEIVRLARVRALPLEDVALPPVRQRRNW